MEGFGASRGEKARAAGGEPLLPSAGAAVRVPILNGNATASPGCHGFDRTRRCSKRAQAGAGGGRGGKSERPRGAAVRGHAGLGPARPRRRLRDRARRHTAAASPRPGRQKAAGRESRSPPPSPSARKPRAFLGYSSLYSFFSRSLATCRWCSASPRPHPAPLPLLCRGRLNFSLF